jgi:hypothetical protein
LDRIAFATCFNETASKKSIEVETRIKPPLRKSDLEAASPDPVHSIGRNLSRIRQDQRTGLEKYGQKLLLEGARFFDDTFCKKKKRYLKGQMSLDLSVE